MSRRRLVCVPLLVLLIAPVAAHAQLPGQPAPAPQPAPPPPAPKPQAGKAGVSLRGGVATKHLRYLARGQRLLVVGRVKPFVAGQVVTVELRRGRKALARKRVRVRQAKRGGLFSVRFKAKGRGVLRVRARHRATPQQAAFSARSGRLKVVRWRAGQGSHGTKVLLLQRRLLSLGYATPISGTFDGGTARAVTTFRSVNELGRDGFATTAVYRKLLAGQGAFKLRYPRAGKHVEFDWSGQVVVLADKGRPYRVYHASSGKPSTPTVFGTYHFYSKTPGTNSHGMVDSNYFVRGYAIHGYPEVPNYAASHGCIRVPIPNAAAIYAWIGLGDTIFVYR
jgi:L,D-transpeptidase-like protein/putative peptidoglycan binding protein